VINIDKGILNKQAYVVTTGLNTISGTAEHPYLLLDNVSATVRILVHHVSFGLDSNTVRALSYTYRDPTVTTNGTELTIHNTYVGADNPASTMKAYKDPTVSANGTYENLAIEPKDGRDRGLNRTYFIDPGHKLLVTAKNSVSNTSTFVQIYFLEDV